MVAAVVRTEAEDLARRLVAFAAVPHRIVAVVAVGETDTAAEGTVVAAVDLDIDHNLAAVRTLAVVHKRPCCLPVVLRCRVA